MGRSARRSRTRVVAAPSERERARCRRAHVGALQGEFKVPAQQGQRVQLPAHVAECGPGDSQLSTAAPPYGAGRLQACHRCRQGADEPARRRAQQHGERKQHRGEGSRGCDWSRAPPYRPQSRATGPRNTKVALTEPTPRAAVDAGRYHAHAVMLHQFPGPGDQRVKGNLLQPHAQSAIVTGLTAGDRTGDAGRARDAIDHHHQRLAAGSGRRHCATRRAAEPRIAATPGRPVCCGRCLQDARRVARPGNQSGKQQQRPRPRRHRPAPRTARAERDL